MNAAGRYLGIEDMRDMDYVITTRELAMLAKDEGIDFAALEDSAYDDLMGQASGAGVIFGNTGGVMEAAIRTAYCYATGKDAPQALYDLQPVRGMDGIREAEVDIEGTKVKVAVVYGTANARKLIEKLKQAKQSTTLWKLWPARAAASAAADSPRTRNIKATLCVRHALKGFISATAA